jgi:hypothetical protein
LRSRPKGSGKAKQVCMVWKRSRKFGLEEIAGRFLVYFPMEGVRPKYSLAYPCQMQRGSIANVHPEDWNPWTTLLYSYGLKTKQRITTTPIYARTLRLETFRSPADCHQDVLFLATPPIPFAPAFDFRKFKLRIRWPIPNTSRENK